MKKLFMLSGFVLALVASLAFKPEKKQSGQIGYYYSELGTCVEGTYYQSPCSPSFTGPACTILDPSTDKQVQAYYTAQFTTVCAHPLYQYSN